MYGCCPYKVRSLFHIKSCLICFVALLRLLMGNHWPHASQKIEVTVKKEFNTVEFLEVFVLYLLVIENVKSQRVSEYRNSYFSLILKDL